MESIMRFAFGLQNRTNLILKIAFPITIKLQLLTSNACRLIHSNLIRRVLFVGQVEFNQWRAAGMKYWYKQHDLHLNWYQFRVNSWWRKNKLKHLNETISYFYNYFFVIQCTFIYYKYNNILYMIKVIALLKL